MIRAVGYIHAYTKNAVCLKFDGPAIFTTQGCVMKGAWNNDIILLMHRVDNSA